MEVGNVPHLRRKRERKGKAVNLWQKIAAAREAVGPIAKSAKNPHFGNHYAPLGEIEAQVVPALDGVNLFWTSGAVSTASGWAWAVRIVDVESGEDVACMIPLAAQPDAQKMGGCLTYFDRYGIAKLMRLDIGEADDDGNTAAGQGQGRPASRPSVPASNAQGSPPASRPTPPRSATATASGGQGGKGNPKFGACPNCRAQAVIPGKPEFGGGWLCWKKEGGCGTKFKENPALIPAEEHPATATWKSGTGKMETEQEIDARVPDLMPGEELPF